MGFATSGALQIFFISDRIVSAIQSLSLLQLQYQFVFMLLGLQHASPTRFDSIDNHANLFLPARTCVPSLLLEGTVLLAPCHRVALVTCAISKTRVASKTRKTACALRLASKLKSVPLAIKLRINNQKSRASPTQNWIAVGRLVATYNFAASLFRTARTARTVSTRSLSLDHV